MAGMEIWLFDVDQGAAAFVRAPNGASMMIDCGRKDSLSPVLWVRENLLSDVDRASTHPLTKLVVTHPHDDHIEDIENLTQQLRPRIISRNLYDWLEVENESGGDYENLRQWAKFQATYMSPVGPVDWGGMEVSDFGLSVEEAKELNEAKFINNSSIVTVLGLGGFKVVLPGDVERDGWLELLRREDVRTAVSGTDVFITSHHGHPSGYAAELYEIMGCPFFNVSSIHGRDTSIEKAYSSEKCAKGVQWEGEKRYHFTTRADGTFHLTVSPEGGGKFEFLTL